jgi:hypothetical protein
MDNNALTIALAHAGLLADAGIKDISLLDVAKSALNGDTLSKLVANAATDSQYLASEEIIVEGSKVFSFVTKEP